MIKNIEWYSSSHSSQNENDANVAQTAVIHRRRHQMHLPL